MPIVLDSIDRDLIHFLEHLLQKVVEQQKAMLSIESRDTKEGHGTSVTITSTKPGCASIIGYAESGDPVIYVTLGLNTRCEVPIEGKRYTDLEGEDELATLIQAVISGNFSETVWRKHLQIVKSVGRIRVADQHGGQPITILVADLISNPFVHAEKYEYVYLPY